MSFNEEIILDSLELGVFVKDLNLKYVYTNLLYEKMLFHSSTTMIGRGDCDLFSQEIADKLSQNDDDVIEKKELIDKVESFYIEDKTYVFRIIKKPFFVDGTCVGILGTLLYISQKNEKLLHNLAYFDSLTKLPNRVLFEERVNTTIASLKRNNKKMAILFIDMDNFKNVNDTYGHIAGDRFLIEVSKYIKKFLREKDTLARLGGDEFTVILNDIDNISDIVPIANRIVNRFNKPIIIDENKIYSGVSVGISVYPDDATNYKELIKAADTAMYQVKNSGKNAFLFYRESMNADVTLRTLMEKDLGNAIINDELFLEYQPKVDLETNSIYGMEALIRWNHKEMGLLKPDKFIYIAEEAGLIYKIGLWVVSKAVRDTKSLHDDGHNLIVSINISSKQLENRNFVLDICSIIDEIGLDKDYIEMEISESNIMHDLKNASKVLGELHEKGFKISIDDFGTGYSSLSYLKKLPADTIKIDRSFVYDIDSKEDERSVVEAIIGMGKSIGKEVVAEGSETIGEVEALRFLHCYKVQGYYFSKPLRIKLFKKFINAF